MSNITLSVDEDIIKKVRKIAIDKNTTLTAMVRDFLKSVAENEEIDKQRILNQIDESFTILSRDMGPRAWTRDELYDR